METSSSCVCRLGVIVRALGLGSRPFPEKRQWQFCPRERTSSAPLPKFETLAQSSHSPKLSCQPRLIGDIDQSRPDDR